jgi:uncharacterized repeat protein (TIGR01451 family)
MLAKLRSLLLPLANLKNKATIIRLGLAGLVLGIGGFAVYKGAQQMKPKRPTPRPTQTAANKLKPPADDLDPTRNLSGDSPIGFDSGQSPSAEASADSLYNQGAEQNPATVQTEDLYATNDQGTQVEEGTAGADGIPASPLQGHATSSEQPVEGDGSSMGTAPANRIRRLPTAPGNYRIADETSSEVATQQPMEAGDSGETPGQYDGSGPNVDGSQYADGGTGYATGDPSAAAEGPPEAAEVVTPETASNLRTPQTLPGNGSRRTQPLPSAPEVQPVNTPRMLGGLNAAGAAAPGGTPGDRQFEGTQVPSIAIEKFAPAEIQVGKAATFEVRVRNAGQVAAHDVLVTDQVPQGTRLESTSPEAQLAEDGSLAWQLGEMQPGDEVVLSMQVMPEQEGEIGSVAHVTFAGRATARSVCTRPLLNIEHTAPKQVLIGETVRLGITVNNPGTGAATGVIVEEDVPEGLVHVAGGELEYEIGTLRPNETRQLELQLTADKPGLIENMVTVRGEGNLIAQHTVQIEVIAPQLSVAVSGPKKRYLERQATYTLSIENPGTAAARSVQLVAFLPKGMKFQSTDAEGQYDPTQHAVFWSLEELPANKSGSVNLVAVPVETGEQRLRVEGKADLGLTAANEQVVQVEAKSELEFNIVDLNDPIEVGTDTSYEIRVTNKGTRPATAVELVAGFPQGGEIKAVSADGHARGEVSGNGQQVAFEPVGRINPGEEMVFRIHAQGAVKGDHVIAVQIRSAEFPLPVTREESTRVYEDR